ncbi:unnamed protein product [Blepharisma stoltei]|uniref:Importin subunit alpha n=1 Tax=Blepharisma stoltei TaxID=1481888 RepID=A0AAU9JLH1_9CILI|nr:unnamed protein product [Blepharisma stoltei]
MEEIQNYNDPANQENSPIASAISNDNIQAPDSQSPNPAAAPANLAVTSHTDIQIEDQPILAAANKIHSNNSVLQFEGLQFLRKSLSKVDNPPIDDVIKTGICQHIISLAYEKDDDKFLFEATWLFTNILSGSSEQGSYLLKLGVLPFLFTVFKKNNYDIKEQVMWAFGNVAGDSAKCRDTILNHEKFNYVYEFLAEVDFQKQSVIRTLSWVVSNFIRGKPQPKLDKVIPLFSFLERVILGIHDVEALTDATWGCSYLTDIDGSLPIFKNELFLEKIIQQLSSNNASLQISSLRTLGNISSSLPNSYEIMFRLGFLDKIDELILCPKKNVRKEICWMLSNICAEKKEAVEGLLERKVYEKLLKVLKEDSEDVKKEAIWVIGNTATVCDAEQARRVAQIGLIGEMISLVDKMKASQKVVLEGLTEYFGKDKNIVGSEERNRLIRVLDRVIEEGENSDKAVSLRLMLLDINNGEGNN